MVVNEEVKELEEYARQYEVTGRGSRGARATPACLSGRDSVMTITSSVVSGSVSGHSDSSGETLRPTPSIASSSHSPIAASKIPELSESGVNYRPNLRSGLPSVTPTLVPANNELRDGAGSVYTKMRPVFHAGYNDGRRKSDFFSFSSNYGGFYKAGPGIEKADVRTSGDTPAHSRIPTDHAESCSTSLQQSCSVSDRINHMERLSRVPVTSPGHVPSSPRGKTPSEDDFHLSKSVPNLLSENEVQFGQKDENDSACVVDTSEPSYTYLDPEKKLKVTDNTLKLIQKQAVLDYYTRQKKSSTDLTKDVRRTSLNRSEDNESEKDSKNSSFDTERRFLRSVSQGSLSGSCHNSESYTTTSVITKGSPGPASNQSSPSRFPKLEKIQVKHRNK